jgi:ArsR family metal-binding transcriptional regulator
MILRTYEIEIFRPECNPHFQSLHCFAHLGQDISEALPYLNTVLGATNYQQSPPSLTLQVQGQLISLHSKKIAINALKSPEDADKILIWLKDQINEVWEKRDSIEPSYGVAEKPKLIEILKLLPKTNCRKCLQPTCTVFASLVVQGVKTGEDCPEMDIENLREMKNYLDQFQYVD